MILMVQSGCHHKSGSRPQSHQTYEDISFSALLYDHSGETVVFSTVSKPAMCGASMSGELADTREKNNKFR